jgi:hypothetical protein
MSFRAWRSWGVDHGLRVHTWRDANVIHKVSIHLTLIIKAYGVSRFSAVVAVPHQIAGSRKAKMRKVLVRRETELTSETTNEPLLGGGIARQHEIQKRHGFAMPSVQHVSRTRQPGLGEVIAHCLSHRFAELGDATGNESRRDCVCVMAAVVAKRSDCGK